jgi:small membrane protein
MPIIKLLLLGGIAVFGILAFRGGQSAGHRAFWRLAGLVVIVTAALSVLFPNSLTTVAQAIGVNRGSDLLLYVLVVAFMLVVVILFRRIGELEQRYIDLVRQLAIDEASRTETGNDEAAPHREDPRA